MKDRFTINLFWQPLLAVLYIAVVLFVFSHTNSSQIVWAVGVGSLSSSACSVFAAPTSRVAQTPQIIKGYLIGVAVGIFVHILLKHLLPHLNVSLFHFNSNAFWVLACIAVGLTMIIMTLCDVFHPPAVGMALVLVLEIQHYGVLGVIVVAALVLAAARYILDPYLKDLVD